MLRQQRLGESRNPARFVKEQRQHFSLWSKATFQWHFLHCSFCRSLMFFSSKFTPSVCTLQFGKWTGELERCSSENQAGVHVTTTQWQISKWVAFMSSSSTKKIKCYCLRFWNNTMCASLVSKISPVKQSQLRNFLSKGQMPPVRSTAPGMNMYTPSAFPSQFLTKYKQNNCRCPHWMVWSA